MTDRQVIPEIAFLSWFMCLYVNVLPTTTVMRAWDALLVDGRDTLLRVGLAVLRACERVILAADQSFDLNQVLQKAPLHLLDADKLLAQAFCAVRSPRDPKSTHQPGGFCMRWCRS